MLVMVSSLWKTNILKIGLLTLTIVMFMQLYNYISLGEDSNVALIWDSQNAANFSSANTSNHLGIWVALSTRIGIQFTDGSSSWVNESFYKEIASVWETIEEKKQIRSKLIGQNMLIIWEYLNISRSDISSLLKTSNNREKTLEWYISQLEIRSKNSQLSLESLEKHKTQLLAEIWEIEAKIEATKSNMEKNFSSSNASATLENVDDYFTLRERYTVAFTDIVFINQFIKQHNFLINYNAGILNTLKVNKKAIIDESYVVIPESWDQYLRPLELIFDEGEVTQ